MKEIFIQNTRRGAQSNKLYVQSQHSKKYGSDTLRSLGPKIWNSLPINFRETLSLGTFKQLIKTWSGPQCHCNQCRFKWSNFTNICFSRFLIDLLTNPTSILFDFTLNLLLSWNGFYLLWMVFVCACVCMWEVR